MVTAAFAGEPSAAVDRHRAEISRLEREQQRLLNQVRHEISLLPPEPSVDAKLSPTQQALLERRRELVALVAEVERRIKSDKDGRIKYISSGVTDEPYKAYFQRFQRRVEEAGTQEFPRVDGGAIYGEVLLGVSITPTGQIARIEVHRSSSDALTNHASKLLRKLEPFEAYGAQLGQGVELVVITVPFSYRRE